MKDMEQRRIFEILGIEETKEEEEIRAAYRRKLVSVNPEDNPEGFKQLREAYEKALSLAGQKEEEGQGNAEKKEPDGPAGLFLKEVEEVYRSLSSRLDLEAWERVLKNELLDDLELGEEIKWALFRYLSEYYRIPVPVWKLLDGVFGIVENAGEFKEYLPENFVDFMVWKCSEGAESSDFPFEKLRGEDTADYDAFINHYNELAGLFAQEDADREEQLKKIGQKIVFMDGFGISHPWFEMEKAKYKSACGEKEEAQRMVHSLWDAGEKDRRMLLAGANVLKECGLEDEAAEIYQRLLKDKDLPNESIYKASMELAEIYAGRQEWKEGREHAQRAVRLYNTRQASELLDRCNTGMIALYAGERAEGLTAEDAVALGWAYIQNGQAAEGLAFFREHRLLTEDTVKCRQVRTVLFMSCGLGEETKEEAALWRKCLFEEKEKEKEEKEKEKGEGENASNYDYWIAQSYEMEGKAFQMCYSKLEDKEGEEAGRLEKLALEAFGQAVALQPEETDFLLAELLFFRELKDYGKMIEICEQIKAVDKGYFWAYYYAQEAHEGLGKAQEVVDSFYEAKEIYAGLPEIYERAARVFWEYRQYSEVESILRQAEEAGVGSFYLRLRRLELMQRAAKDADALKEADAFAGQLIAEMEETEDADAGILSEAYLQRAYIHDENEAGEFRQEDGMEEWVKRSIELSDNLRNRYFLGRFYVEYREDAKPAYGHLKICEERGMDFEWMYYYIARSLESFEKWDEAIEYYIKAHEKNPEEFDFIWRIAWLYRWKYSRISQKEYYDTTMHYLKLHVEKFGENPRELWQLSDMHARHREYGLALEEIDRALKEVPNARNWGHKGLLLEMLGSRGKAVFFYRKGIEAAAGNGEDYKYGYSQMHDFFCETRNYQWGLEWFQGMLPQMKTKEGRETVLSYIRYYYTVFHEWEKALETIMQVYGGVTLTEYVCAGWEDEGERIDDLLDLYQQYVSPEELRMYAEEAAALLEGGGAAALEEDHEGRQSAYVQIAYCYSNYLMEPGRAMEYFRKALAEGELTEDGINCNAYRRTLRDLMFCCRQTGNPELAKEYQARHKESLEMLYADCKDLGRDAEELYAGDCGFGRANCYSLFVVYYFCGEYEKAGQLLERMEASEWCWNCTRGECTEEWECRGYMALYRGDTQEAIRCFEHAVACGGRGNFDAQRELRILERV